MGLSSEHAEICTRVGVTPVPVILPDSSRSLQAAKQGAEPALVSAAQLGLVVAVNGADPHDALQRLGQLDPLGRQLLAVAAPARADWKLKRDTYAAPDILVMLMSKLAAAAICAY